MAIIVPSVALSRALNMLLNPRQPEFETYVSLAGVAPFFFDPQLFK